MDGSGMFQDSIDKINSGMDVVCWQEVGGRVS